MSMDRLVELFLSSARYNAGEEPSSLSALPQDGGHLDSEATERGLVAMEKMLTSDDGIRMGVDPRATYVCLGMALEEKEHLMGAATRVYEKALEQLDMLNKRMQVKGGSWERATVLQQLGTVCLRQGRAKEGARWLDECSAECGLVDGHPRDAVLFGGACNTKQTRLDFVGTVHKLLAKAYQDLGDNVLARQHYEEVKRLSQLQSCDAVERAVARGEPTQPNVARGGTETTSAPSSELRNDPKALWEATFVEEKQFAHYRFADEGATVLLTIDLNDHLGIGEEASSSVHSLKQFRVNCKEDRVDVCVRLRPEEGHIFQFQLLLQPLVHEIIPEDTVPRLKGREGKRRLEVKLFKRDKKIEWRGDLVKSEGKPKAAKVVETARLGSQLNPLNAEELARLPRPSTTGSDNRPSSWQAGPVLLHREEVPSPSPYSALAAPLASSSAPAAAAKACVSSASPVPAWVKHVERRQLPAGGLEVDVHLAVEAGENVSMDDLELDGDESAGLRLGLRGVTGSPLVISIPAGNDCAAMKARWRRKPRVLELRFPSL